MGSKINKFLDLILDQEAKQEDPEVSRLKKRKRDRIRKIDLNPVSIMDEKLKVDEKIKILAEKEEEKRRQNRRNWLKNQVKSKEGLKK